MRQPAYVAVSCEHMESSVVDNTLQMGEGNST